MRPSRGTRSYHAVGIIARRLCDADARRSGPCPRMPVAAHHEGRKGGKRTGDAALRSSPTAPPAREPGAGGGGPQRQQV